MVLFRIFYFYKLTEIEGYKLPKRENIIASMASIISLKFYLQEEDSSILSYLKIFLLVHIVMLAVLIPTYYLFN